MIDHTQAYKLDLATNEITPTDELQSRDTRRVGYDRLEGIEISTMFMGYDLRVSDEDGDKPLYFETYLTAARIPILHGYIARYPSYVAARAGHEFFCQFIDDNRPLIRSLRSALKTVGDAASTLIDRMDSQLRAAGAFIT